MQANIKSGLVLGSCLLGLALLGTSSTFAGTLSVPGTSDPYLAGMPSGSGASFIDTAPAESPVLVPGSLPSPGSAITFTNVTGSVSYQGGTPTDPPDGSFNVQHYDAGVGPGSPAQPENGISDMAGPVDSLVGVFLSATAPNLSPAPASLDFTGGTADSSFTVVPGGIGFSSLAPQLQQLFFIGDGLTGTGTGSVQQFIVPAGATRLYLGTLDGFGWSNNTGAIDVTVNNLGSAVPLPSAAWTGLALLGGLGVTRLRKLRTI